MNVTIPKKITMHILLVEDNADDAFLTQEAFQGLDRPPQFTICVDGQAALEYLEELLRNDERLPDLLLLDLNMPRLDGFGLLKRLKAHPELRHVPVLIFTTSISPADVRRSYAEHANGYICKPRIFSEYSRVVDAVQRFWLDVAQLPR